MSNAYSTGILSKDSATEHDRLAAIQRNTDSFTRGAIEALGITPSWDCLELGAGAGSIAYWLTERCPDGRVVANDIDTRYLKPGKAPNLEVEQADLTAPDYSPGQFDLIHARYVLCHLPERDEVIARAVNWLKPGGHLVVEDPYMLPPETSPFPVIHRILAAYQAKYSEHGADLTWVRGLPSVLASSGLTDVGFVGNLGCMGCLGKDRWLPLITQVAPSLIADGTVTEADLNEFTELLKDPGFVDIPQLTICAWGRAAFIP